MIREKLVEEVHRRRAVALAGHKGDEAAARRGLTDPAAIVRATAVGALRRMQRLGPTDVLATLGDPSPLVRRRACEASIAFLGSEAALTAAVSGALGDSEALVVESACFALGEAIWPAVGETALPGAIAGLSAVARNHRDALCREAAVAALGAIGDPAGLAAILTATTDKPAIRRRAVLALAPFEGPEVDAALSRALEDPDWQVRQAAEDLG